MYCKYHLVFVLYNRNTEAGAGRTGGRSHRSYSAAISRLVRTQPQPTVHVKVSWHFQMQDRDGIRINGLEAECWLSVVEVIFFFFSFFWVRMSNFPGITTNMLCALGVVSLWKWWTVQTVKFAAWIFAPPSPRTVTPAHPPSAPTTEPATHTCTLEVQMQEEPNTEPQKWKCLKAPTKNNDSQPS